MKKPRSKKKIIISVLCVLLALAVLTPCVINAVVMLSASKYIIRADEAAGRGADCVLVLGAKVNSNGTLSHMLEDRMSTGVDLYQSGAGKKILASGDHGRDSYDEVNHMKQYAVGRGVDPDDVFLDHAGFSTYESMYRLAAQAVQPSQNIVAYHPWSGRYAPCFSPTSPRFIRHRRRFGDVARVLR